MSDNAKKPESTCDIAGLLEEAESIEDTIGRHEGKGGAWAKVLARRAERARNLRLAAAELWLRRRGKCAGSFWLKGDRKWELPEVIFNACEGMTDNYMPDRYRIYDTKESAWAAAVEATATAMKEGKVEL